MSTKRTKAEKSQRKDEQLEKRLHERAEQDEKRKDERDSSQADVDSVKH